MTTSRSATTPLVVHSFTPFSTYSLPSADGIAVVLSLAGSEPTSGSVSRNALISPRAHRGRYFCFCSSVPNSASGCGTPIDWCADSSAASAGRRGAHDDERAVVVQVGEAEPAVGGGDFHSERSDARQSLDHLIGNPGFAFNQRAVHRRFAEVAQPGAELLAALSGLVPLARVRVDQAELEVAEEELSAEAGQRPLGLPGLLRDLAGLSLADLRAVRFRPGRLRAWVAWADSWCSLTTSVLVLVGR